MKLSEIDFRVWSKLENRYIEYPALAKLGSVLPAKVHRADRAIPFIEFDERDDEKEVEFWTGLRDLNNAKIYEGDILRYYRESTYKPFVDYYVVDMHYKIDFKAIDEKEAGFLKELKKEVIYLNSNCLDSEIIGNIHENPELLGGDE